MQEPAERGPDGSDAAADGATARRWVHPSELGLQTRSRSDRRRGTWLASTLVLGGLGLLAFGLIIGVGADRDPGTAASSPDRGVSASLASLTVLDGQSRRTVTGVVLDAEGHVAVRSGSVSGAQEVWVSCGGAAPQAARVVAHDDGLDLAVVALGEPAGRPVTAAGEASDGDDVLLARAGVGESAPSVSPGRVAAVRAEEQTGQPPTMRVVASGASAASTLVTAASTEPAGPDGAAFDRRGRFVGLVVAGDHGAAQLLPAATVFEVATALLR